MAKRSGTHQKEGASWRWRVLAGAGLVLALIALLRANFWTSAAVLFIFFIVLAYGTPFRRYRKFVHRGVLPAGGIILIATWFLDTRVLLETVADPIVRSFLSFAVSVPLGIIPVFFLIELYGRVRLHWVTTLAPDIQEKDAPALLRNSSWV